MKKVAIYIRVSTQEQAKEGYSIEAQKEALINFCKAKQWNIYNIYIDGGYSGSNINRPALDRLLNELDKIDIVLVYKLDRLSRSQKDTLYLIEEKFIKNNVDFVSMTESFDTGTPIGMMMVGILSTFAQFERENIKERITTGRIERAKEGYWVGTGRPPIGYDYVNGQLIVNEYEAMQVKEIFDMYLKGYGQIKIRNILHNKGYTTKYGSWLNSSEHTIYRIITNQVYIGKVAFNSKYDDGNHKAIIDEEIFNKANNLLDKRKGKSTKRKHLLTGLLICKKCNKRYTTDKGNKYSYYICHNRKRGYKADVEKCFNKIWRVEDLEKRVVDIIKEKTKDEESIRKAYNEMIKNRNQNNNEVIEKRIKKIDNQINKLMDLYQFDKLPTHVISERIEKLYNEKKTLESQKVDTLENDFPTFEEVYEYMQRFNKIWDRLDRERKIAVLDDMIEAIYVDDDDIDVKIRV